MAIWRAPPATGLREPAAGAGHWRPAAAIPVGWPHWEQPEPAGATLAPQIFHQPLAACRVPGRRGQPEAADHWTRAVPGTPAWHSETQPVPPASQPGWPWSLRGFRPQAFLRLVRLWRRPAACRQLAACHRARPASGRRGRPEAAGHCSRAAPGTSAWQSETQPVPPASQPGWPWSLRGCRPQAFLRLVRLWRRPAPGRQVAACHRARPVSGCRGRPEAAGHCSRAAPGTPAWHSEMPPVHPASLPG